MDWPFLYSPIGVFLIPLTSEIMVLSNRMGRNVIYLVCPHCALPLLLWRRFGSMAQFITWCPLLCETACYCHCGPISTWYGSMLIDFWSSFLCHFQSQMWVVYPNITDQTQHLKWNTWGEQNWRFIAVRDFLGVLCCCAGTLEGILREWVQYVVLNPTKTPDSLLLAAFPT
jgi:hypothetical protein